jgi:hypothetical protein
LLTVLACRAGWLWNYYLWRRVRIVVWIGWGIVVAIIAGDDDEAIAEVVISIVISVVISGVSVSSRTLANYAAAGRSAADMSSSESTATRPRGRRRWSWRSAVDVARPVRSVELQQYVARPNRR